MSLQSVVFLHPTWNLISAKSKLREMKLKLLKGKKIDVVKDKSGRILQYRFRIAHPNFKRYVTKKLPNDILLIIGI